MEKNAERIPAVDAIRGMALLGILYVHMHDGYNGFSSAGGTGWWNEAATWIYAELFLAKAYLVFSFLFGLSFALQLGRAEARGRDVRLRFLWRLALLFLFGIVNTLFYGGDILMVFAVFGAVLVPFWRVRASLAAGVAALLSLHLPFLFDACRGGESCLSPLCRLLDGLVRPMPDAATASWGALARWNMTDGLPARLSYMISSGRLCSMLAMFLWGMLAGRAGLYGTSPGARRFWKRAGCASCAGAALFLLLEAAAPFASLPAWEKTLAAWRNMAEAMLFLSVCFLVLNRPAWAKASLPFRAAGRASLSCYVGQSVLGTMLLFGWGAGLGSTLTAGTNALLVVAIFAVQCVVCLWWLRRYRFGPLEWLWRSATYGRMQPLRKRESTAPAAR